MALLPNPTPFQDLIETIQTDANAIATMAATHDQDISHNDGKTYEHLTALEWQKAQLGNNVWQRTAEKLMVEDRSLYFDSIAAWTSSGGTTPDLTSPGEPFFARTPFTVSGGFNEAFSFTNSDVRDSDFKVPENITAVRAMELKEAYLMGQTAFQSQEFLLDRISLYLSAALDSLKAPGGGITSGDGAPVVADWVQYAFSDPNLLPKLHNVAVIGQKYKQRNRFVKQNPNKKAKLFVSEGFHKYLSNLSAFGVPNSENRKQYITEFFDIVITDTISVNPGKVASGFAVLPSFYAAKPWVHPVISEHVGGYFNEVVKVQPTIGGDELMALLMLQKEVVDQFGIYGTDAARQNIVKTMAMFVKMISFTVNVTSPEQRGVIAFDLTDS